MIGLDFAKVGEEIWNDLLSSNLQYNRTESVQVGDMTRDAFVFSTGEYSTTGARFPAKIIDELFYDKETGALLKWTRTGQLVDVPGFSQVDATIQTGMDAIEFNKPTIQASGGCLIATATYGSEMAPQVQFLREIRDNTVMSTQSGALFMSTFNMFYYSFSPSVADWERQNPMFKEMVQMTIFPLLLSLTLLEYVDIDTEGEMLGYGIGIILVNIGIYFVLPALFISKIKNRFIQRKVNHPIVK